MREWKKYSCQIPKKTGDFSDGSCREISDVHHVVHVPEARRILEDGRIRASLVEDESRLRRSRICVSWLSANSWARGSIYGNIQFTFDWNKIIMGRNIYWVEAIEYGVHAYRLLLTGRTLKEGKLAQPYDPSSDDGPLKKCKRRGWFWNGKYTSEFMIEDDLIGLSRTF